MQFRYVIIAVALGLASLAVVFPAPGEPGTNIVFKEVAAAAGIRAQMRCGSPQKHWIPEANGSGAAWLDYDNDGRMDLLLVNGSGMDELRATVAGQKPSPATKGVYLYHNLGGGHFEDVTDKAGLTNIYWGTGANAADFNNDGYTDILITTIGIDLLYKNNANGTFTEVGKAAGLHQDVRWHTGSAFGDYDGDGNLDLFVTGYVDIHTLSLKEPAPVCEYQGNIGFCGPVGLTGERVMLYHNNGDGTFSDATRQAGLGDTPRAHSFTAVFDDFNEDGKIDIFVANDSDPNFLFLNQGDGTFKEAAAERSVGFNSDGRVQANMGVAVGDYDNRGHLGLLTTTFLQDYFPLFHQEKDGFFEDVAGATRTATITMPYMGWSCGFHDLDNDGWKDLWTANGHVYPNSRVYRQSVAVFRNKNGVFSKSWEYPAAPDNSYRGGCAGDFDNDGRMDLVVLPIAGAPLLLANRTEGGNHWIGLQLRGTRSNRDGIGASVHVEACGKTQFETMRNGGSYLSHNDPRLDFGLGACSSPARITITWPRGARQVVASVAADRYTTIEEPR